MGETTLTKGEECKTCEELEQGDRLYVFGEDDVGITFNKIGDIQYCPVCGKKLLSFKEKLRHRNWRKEQ